MMRKCSCLFVMLLYLSMILTGCSEAIDSGVASSAAIPITEHSEAYAEQKGSVAKPSRELLEGEYDGERMLELISRAEKKPYESSWVRIEEKRRNRDQPPYQVSIYHIQEVEKWQTVSYEPIDLEEATWGYRDQFSQDELAIPVNYLIEYIMEKGGIWKVHDYEGRRAITIKINSRFGPTNEFSATAIYIFDVDEGVLLFFRNWTEGALPYTTDSTIVYSYFDEMELPESALEAERLFSRTEAKATQEEHAINDFRKLAENEYDNLRMLELISRAVKKPYESSWVRIEENTEFGEYTTYTLTYYQVQERKKWQGYAEKESDPEELTWSYEADFSQTELIHYFTELRSWLKKHPSQIWVASEDNNRNVVTATLVNTDFYPPGMGLMSLDKYLFDVDEGCLLLHTYSFTGAIPRHTDNSTRYEYAEKMELPKAALAAGR